MPVSHPACAVHRRIVHAQAAASYAPASALVNSKHKDMAFENDACQSAQNTIASAGPTSRDEPPNRARRRALEVEANGLEHADFLTWSPTAILIF
jgi:hypothetical protein